MGRAAAIAFLVLCACGGREGQGPLIDMEVTDDAKALSVGIDPLFEILYCVGKSDRTFAVSGLHLTLDTQHSPGAPVGVRFLLSTDLDGDGRFGPGDVLSVLEKAPELFTPSRAGTWRVTLYDGDDQLLGMAEWHAR